VGEVSVVEGVFSAGELNQIHRVKFGCPAYVRSGDRLPHGLGFWGAIPASSDPQLRFAPELPDRADAVRYGRRLAEHTLASTGKPRVSGHSSYLRATYAAHGEPLVAGIEEILRNNRLASMAAEVFDADIVVPLTVYANVYLPGQVLDVHTDIPAFRGVELGQAPAWLLVAMHHSGLFERWRIPIATVIGHPNTSQGGEFSYFPPAAPPGVPSVITLDPPSNSAVALDADTIFHRVDQVAGETTLLPELAKGAYLVPSRPTLWRLCRREPAGALLGTFRNEEIRYTISWKAYCFPDENSRQTWIDHTDDLRLDEIIPMLTELLCDRGELPGPEHGLSEVELGAVIIDALIPFPAPGS